MGEVVAPSVKNAASVTADAALIAEQLAVDVSATEQDFPHELNAVRDERRGRTQSTLAAARERRVEKTAVLSRSLEVVSADGA